MFRIPSQRPMTLRIVLLTRLSEGQEATVLQLPAQPTTAVQTHRRWQSAARN